MKKKNAKHKDEKRRERNGNKRTRNEKRNAKHKDEKQKTKKTRNKKRASG